ncbi:hypothetical protein Tco_1452545, partial [Tanacetum coccineum]
MRSKTRDTLVVVILEVICIKDLVALHFGDTIDFVISNSEDFTVTYTEVSSPFEDLSGIGSSGVIVHGYNRLSMMPEDPYAYVEAALQAPRSPDYVPGPEEPEQAPPLPDFPLPAAVSPIVDSPGYITESDFEEDPEEDDEDLEEDPSDYPTDRDDDKEEEESFGDDADDEDKDEDEAKDEEEHLALADSVPPPACRTTATMSIWDQTPIPFLFAAEVDRFLAISTPPPSPLTSYSSPLPQIPSPPLPVSSPLPMSPPTLPTSLTHPLGYRAAIIRLRDVSPSTSHPLPIVLPHTRASIAMMSAATPSTYILASLSKTPPSGTLPLLPIPLPTPSPPFLLPFTDCRAGVSRPTREFKRDYSFVTTLDDEIRRDLERDVGYEIIDTWDDMVKDMQRTPIMTDVTE